MDFSDALKHLRAGHALRRSTWDAGTHVYLSDSGRAIYTRTHAGFSTPWIAQHHHLLAHDWEVTEC